MTDLYAALHTATIASLFVVSMVPTFLLMLVQAVYSRRLWTTAAPAGIVSLELAGTEARAGAIVASWDDGGRNAAISGLWLDFLYLLSYATTLVLGCAWSARHIGRWSEGLSSLGWHLAWLTVLAAIFDAVENVALLVQLYKKPRTPWPAVAFLCASAKFALLIVVVVFVFVGVVSWVANDWIDRIQVVLAVVGAGVLIRAYLASLPALIRFAFGHAAIVIVVIVVYGIVFGQIGTDYGLDSLFCNDQVLTRVSASLGVTLLLADLGVIVYFASPELVAVLIGSPPWNGKARTVRDNIDYLGRFLTAGGMPLLLLLLAPALLPAVFPEIRRSSDVGTAWYWAYCVDLAIWASGIALGVVITALILRLIHALAGLWGGVNGMRDDLRISILIFYGAFVAVYVLLAGPFYSWVSPALAICALLGVLVMTYALSQYFIPFFSPAMSRWPVPPGAILVGVMVVVLALANTNPYKLQFPNMAGYYPGGTMPGLVDLRHEVHRQYAGEKQAMPAGAASLISDSDALKGWLAAVNSGDLGAQGGGGNPKLAIVAVSGGAARSAFWSAVVLERLEAQIAGFGKHVRIMTGASGGMVGAAYAIVRRHNSGGTGTASALTSAIPVNSITPVAAYIALRDLWQAALPMIRSNDRGIVLEQDWKEIDVPLQSLRESESKGEIPSIILSPMMIEDGRRLLISNLDLWKLTRAEGSAITGRDPGTTQQLYSLSAIEFYRLFPFATEFHLSTAVRMSASFPYVSPAVNLPTDPPRRVVDAGYYDNYGIQVAAAWLDANFDWLVRETSGVVLIQIRDAISPIERLDVADAPQGFWPTVSRSFQFFTSPIDGVAQARDSSGLFRNDQDVQTLSEHFTSRVQRWIQDNIKDEAQRRRSLERSRAFFTTVIFENSAEVTSIPHEPGSGPDQETRAGHHSSAVALDWYLSRAEQDALRDAILTPPANATQAERLAKIAALAEKVAQTHGTVRDHWINQLQTALHYEYLVELKAWWDQAGPIR
jgi:hypothetical protein